MIGCDLIRDLKMYNLPIEKFKEFGENIIFMDPDNPERLDEIKIYLGDRITTDMVYKMPNLKWIHLTCVGFDKLIGLNRDDIIITNSKGIMDNSIISTILAFMFSLSRNLHHCIKHKTDRYEFDRYFNEIQDVIEQKCLIVGMGNIGSKLKTICESLGMTVVGMTRKTNNSLKKLVSDVDFVVNLLPHTNETHGIFDINIFDSMKETGYFINVGRGKTVVEDDLIQILKDKVIAGAGLDVFDVEPLPKESELWNLDNVLMTPHIANIDKNYWKNQIELFIDNLQRFKNNKKLKNLMNLERGY